MAKLEETRRLALMPYTPERGSYMDSHLDVKLWRDADRKVIRLLVSTVKVEERSISFGLFQGKGVTLSGSPTHAPKLFAGVAKLVMGQIDARRGDWWEFVASYLRDKGLSLVGESTAVAMA